MQKSGEKMNDLFAIDIELEISNRSEEMQNLHFYE